MQLESTILLYVPRGVRPVDQIDDVGAELVLVDFCLLAARHIVACVVHYLQVVVVAAENNNNNNNNRSMSMSIVHSGNRGGATFLPAIDP